MRVNGVYLNDRGQPIDYLDLEHKIMHVWDTTEDIKSFYRSVESMDEDQIMNALLGLEIFVNMRCNDLFTTFEKCVANGVFNVNEGYTKEDYQGVDEVIESIRKARYS